MVMPLSVLKNMANKLENFGSIEFDDLFHISGIGGLNTGALEFPDFMYVESMIYEW